ncbi:unnamed protein product [Phytophthora lilii]|uniref:Unnamed protein product n=1 Tax=Phytophthora lilii TaxID=2077276 RepID=A0A9W6WVX1_9STRA|nr:unnamed protein product [Phytophthora lilii]
MRFTRFMIRGRTGLDDKEVGSLGRAVADARQDEARDGVLVADHGDQLGALAHLRRFAKISEDQPQIAIWCAQKMGRHKTATAFSEDVGRDVGHARNDFVRVGSAPPAGPRDAPRRRRRAQECGADVQPQAQGQGGVQGLRGRAESQEARGRGRPQALGRRRAVCVAAGRCACAEHCHVQPRGGAAAAGHASSGAADGGQAGAQTRGGGADVVGDPVHDAGHAHRDVVRRDDAWTNDAGADAAAPTADEDCAATAANAEEV